MAGKSRVKKTKKSRKSGFQTLTLQRSVMPGAIVTNAILDVGSNYFFQVSQVPNSSEFSGMFKEFKLNYVRLKWQPALQNTNDLAATPMYTAFNNNNLTTGVLSASSIREQSSCVIRNTQKPFSMKLRPVLKSQVGQSGITTYYSNIPCNKQWLSTDSLQVEYYGLDWVIPSPGVSVPVGEYVITYNITLRGSN